MCLVLFSLPKLGSKDVQWANLSFHAKNFGVEVSTDIQFRSLRSSDFDTVLLASSKGTPLSLKRLKPLK